MCPFANPAGASVHAVVGGMGLISHPLADGQTEARGGGVLVSGGGRRGEGVALLASVSFPTGNVRVVGLCRAPQPGPP